MDNKAVAVELMDMNEQEGRTLELPVAFEQEPMSMNVQGSLCDAIDSAVKVQKVYRSYRARRRLADTAITDGLWWRAIDYAHLNQTTISFFKKSKPENAASRWNRISSNASKVGKGSSMDTRALILSFQHWIEAIDPRHRYGHSLHLYYNAWRKEDSSQPFFYWMDVGDGRKVDLIECPRSKLRQQSIKYLGPLEREKYEYIIVDGKFLHKQSREILDTVKGTEGAKWIFALSTSKRFYAGEKKKGRFHHSSFLAGGATLSAGRVSVDDGVLKTVSAYSGHYRPTDENLASFLAFLEEHEVNLSEVKIESTRESEKYGENQSVQEESSIEVPGYYEPSKLDISYEEKGQPSTPKQVPQTESRGSDLKDLSGGHQSSVVPETVKSQKITSTNGASSFQLQHHVPLNWTAGIELDL